MPWIGGLIAGGASLLSGAMGSKSAGDAADAQTAASQAAIDEQKRQFDLSRGDLAPFRQAGVGGIQRLQALLGYGPKNAGNAERYGDLNDRFTVKDFWNDPVTKLGFRFGLNEGTDSLENMARARGMLNSGATLKALTRYGTDYAGTKANDSYTRFHANMDRLFNRNAAMAGIGQTATQNTAALGQNTANTIGGLMTGAGNARGAAAIAQGNAWGGAGQNIGNWWNSQQMLNRVFPQQGGGGGGGGYSANDWQTQVS